MARQNLTWQSVPNGYALCIHSGCPQANTCLRAIAFALLPREERWVHIVNPKDCTQDGSCTHYQDNQPVRYARSFTRLQEEMLPRQYNEFHSRLEVVWGHNEYFRRRRGERPIPPTEQALVRQVLKEVGAPDGLDFDAYEELIAWND